MQGFCILSVYPAAKKLLPQNVQRLFVLAGFLSSIPYGRTAATEGQANTSAVVAGTVSIIVATAIITIVCNVLIEYYNPEHCEKQAKSGS